MRHCGHERGVFLGDKGWREMRRQRDCVQAEHCCRWRGLKGEWGKSSLLEIVWESCLLGDGGVVTVARELARGR